MQLFSFVLKNKFLTAIHLQIILLKEAVFTCDRYKSVLEDLTETDNDENTRKSLWLTENDVF